MTPANVLRGPCRDNTVPRALAGWWRPGSRVVGVMALALVTWPGRTFAQRAELRGQVRDSASGVPVAGAVIMLLDETGQVIARALTGTTGQYRLPRPAGAVRLRAIRLGFAPGLLPLPRIGSEWATLDVFLSGLERQLPAVGTTVARGCPSPPTAAEAFGLLDQTRAGLLATVVAREATSAQMRVVRYQRELGVDGTTVERQTVRVDSTLRTTTSFTAAQSADDLIDLGFRTGGGGEYTFSAPDADVLLSEGFQRGYCFSLAAPDTARAAQRGLRFSPVRRRDGKVDIAGTIWIDTAQRTLRDIHFQYVGLDRLSEALGAGGRLGFHTLPNGLSFISEWSMRLVGKRDRLSNLGSAQDFSVQEIGGEVAEARASDGSSYFARLGTAHITAVTEDGRPVAAARLRFANTDYQAYTDAFGRASIPFVLPGPYQVLVDEVALEQIGVPIVLPQTVIVPRAAASIMRLVVPTIEQFVAPLCDRTSAAAYDAWLVARVVDAAGEPLGGARYQVHYTRDGQSQSLEATGTVPATGIIAVCSLSRDRDIEITVQKSRSLVARVRERLDRRISVVRISLATLASPATAPPTAPHTMPGVVVGMVRDSATGEAVPNARVSFLGTRLETTTDDSGRFVVGGLTRGAHHVETSTPWMDSVGAVRRSTVSVNDSAPLSLFIPSVTDVLRMSCGAPGSRLGIGAVVGRILTQPNQSVPGGLRVVAEWDSVGDGASVDTLRTVMRSRATATVTESGGFRVCGVPTGRPITVGLDPGAQASALDKPPSAPSGNPIGRVGVPEATAFRNRSTSREVRIDQARRIARIDLLFTP